AATAVYTLSLHDALPIWLVVGADWFGAADVRLAARKRLALRRSDLAFDSIQTAWPQREPEEARGIDGARHHETALRHDCETSGTDRKSTRLNSSHVKISY